jgi:hypothetical protein
MGLELEMMGLPLEELDEGVLPPEDLDELLFEGMMVAAKMVRSSVAILLLGCDVGIVSCLRCNLLVAE